MKYLLSLFLLFFVSIGWCVKVTTPASSSPVNLLKDVQATFTGWASIPATNILTDENWSNSTTGTINLQAAPYSSSIIWNLGTSYTNIILSGKMRIENAATGSNSSLWAELFYSTNGSNYTSAGYVGSIFNSLITPPDLDYHSLTIESLPISGQYIKLVFYGNFFNDETITFYEFTAQQYK